LLLLIINTQGRWSLAVILTSANFVLAGTWDPEQATEWRAVDADMTYTSALKFGCATDWSNGGS
jgi:hypothetical protein